MGLPLILSKPFTGRDQDEGVGRNGSELSPARRGHSHLSKHSSDLKQNGTQDKTPFYSTVFNTLSHGVPNPFCCEC